VHAAGVVIAPDDIVNYTPLEMAQKGVIATQYSMNPIEDLGLLKMDFLGLSNLTIIKNALRIIKKVYGQDIDIASIPMDDKKTFELLKRADTIGVFQLESAGMRRYLKQLKPTVFDDIISMVALYRPGPMQWIDDFIARKHGLKPIEYIHPAVKPALESTYGVIVTQEQVMQISKEMCGFSGGQADTLRKAIGKKIPEVMAKMKSEFIEGGVKTVGADRKLMEKFWGELEDFAAYCFNKAHSACYGLIAYQTAYLKANFPDAFMAALMTSDYDNTDRLAIEIMECKHMGIEVLPPDVNQSFHEFGVVAGENKIRYGLDAIKNVGHGAAEEILRAREEAGGRFESLGDYCRLVSCRTVNRKALESLIKAGALDSFGPRMTLFSNIDDILSFSQRLQKEADAGQVGLFGEGENDDYTPQLKLSDKDVSPNLSLELSWERELLGIYLSHNPLEAYEDVLATMTKPISMINRELDGRIITLGGCISQSREISTKKGSKMSFVTLADNTGEIEAVVFPKLYAQTADIWQRDNFILTKGKVDFSRSEEPKFLVEEAVYISEEDAKNYKQSGGRPTNQNLPGDPLSLKQRLYIRLEDSQNQPLLLTLKEKLDGHQGDTEVVLVTGESSQKQVIKLPQTVSINETSLRELAGLFGSTNVVVR
jgi:DNA polymerase-3 subunit alpha